MRKADAVAWGKLEDPKHKPEPEVTNEMIMPDQEDNKPEWYISDDDISDSDWEDDEEDMIDSKEMKEENKTDDNPPELEEPAVVPPEK